MFGFAIQPPSRVRPNVSLYPPVTARLASDVDIFGELGHIWAVATLIHRDSGETLYEQLGGKLADSAHPLPDNGRGSSSAMKDRAYFCFPDIVIHHPGRYRVRITLMHVDYSCGSSPSGVVTVSEHTDSNTIMVEEGSPRARPNGQEYAFLRILRDDGQQVPLS
ncbi:hypothetical protein BJ875DRAFT_409205 [Amylocarpus encephaloides]|uniref:Velvet domain-containing protein n=1 Tax=Amylocarpus encephaloides TaxID=45428 RepID=A0A9P8C1T6_9HELO|nr:hypothetical protein BJ875DRAFT_409205 [Amylocarpus encephaloides]